MSQAKYYIYRNLTRGGFSVKHKGKVIDHADCIHAEGIEFRVNQAGRDRVLREKKKYVHAYVVADSYTVQGDEWQQLCTHEFNHEVHYNPIKQDCFKSMTKPVTNVKSVLLGNGKVWISQEQFLELRK